MRFLSISVLPLVVSSHWTEADWTLNMKGKMLQRTWCSWHFTGNDLFLLVAKDQLSLISGLMHCYVSNHTWYITCFDIYVWKCTDNNFRRVLQEKKHGFVLCFSGATHCSWLMAGVRHPCQHSLFSPVMKRSSQPLSLIMADHPKWA